MKSEKREIAEGIELPNQEKNLNVWRKGKLQILGEIGSEHFQTSRDKINKKKKSISREWENY